MELVLLLAVVAVVVLFLLAIANADRGLATLGVLVVIALTLVWAIHNGRIT